MIVVGLGADLGDGRAAMAAAVAGLDAEPGIHVTAVSGLYATAPVGGPPQPDYLNAACAIRCAVEPRALLSALHRLEAAAGRTRDVRWGPRTLDLDVLVWEHRAISTPDLVVPHPRLVERRFALEPLLDLWPDAALPDGTPLGRLCDRLPAQGVTRLRDPASGTIRYVPADRGV